MTVQLKISLGFVWSSILQGVAGESPGAGGGAELLAAGLGITITATQQEIILGVAAPLHRQPRQLARGGGGGEEHLRWVVSTTTAAPPLSGWLKTYSEVTHADDYGS